MNAPIKLKPTENKIYVKILSDREPNLEKKTRSNEGLITITKHKPVWLSLSKKRKGIRYLVAEISSAGGNFFKEIGFKESPDGKAICGSGSSYCGGIPFDDVESAIAYLSKYFDVSWCESEENVKTDRTKKNRKFIAPLRKPPTAAIATESFGKFPWNSLLSDTSALFSTRESERIAAFKFFYAKLTQEFKQCNRLKSILGADAYSVASWPNLPGVYAIRKIDAEQNNSIKYLDLIYIGMTGKLSPIGNAIPGRLSLRLQRWDPYAFTESGFLYGYNRDTREYSFKIAAKEFVVDCFIFDSTGTAAPTFLESLLLQAYAFCSPAGLNRLPPGNNAF